MHFGSWVIKCLQDLPLCITDTVSTTMWSCKLCIHQVAVYKQTLNLWHYGLWEAKFVTNYLQLNPETSSSCWLVWPIRPSDKSDAIVAGFLYMFLSGYISISRRRVPTSFPQWPSRPLWGLLFKKANHLPGFSVSQRQYPTQRSARRLQSIIRCSWSSAFMQACT